MRKVALVVVLLAAAGVGVFLVLGKVMTETEIKSRIKELFRESTIVRNPYSIREANLQTEFFDVESYDSGSTHPLEWIEIWKAENEMQEHGRQLDSMTVIQSTKTEASIEFTMLEGFKGSEIAKPDMKPVRYTAKLVYSSSGQKWLVRSLKYASK